MTAALFMAGYLIAGWAAIVAVLALLDDQGAKMMAALKGRSFLAIEPLPMQPVVLRVSPRGTTAKAQPVRATIEWRAAA